MSSSRGLKNLGLIASIVVSGLTLLAWTGQWFTIHLTGAGTSRSTIAVTGDVVAPGLVALALAGLALVAALAIAGPFFRVVLGILQLLIGFTIGFSSVLAIADPIKASASSISTATGVTGESSVAKLVGSVASSPWPLVAVVTGALTMVVGAYVLATSRNWPKSSRKYQAVRLEEADDTANAVSDWDRLSGGNDPTSR